MMIILTEFAISSPICLENYFDFSNASNKSERIQSLNESSFPILPTNASIMSNESGNISLTPTINFSFDNELKDKASSDDYDCSSYVFPDELLLRDEETVRSNQTKLQLDISSSGTPTIYGCTANVKMKTVLLLLSIIAVLQSNS